MSKSSILITGGAGFIGSNLCEYFLQKDYKVRCADNFATGRKRNLESLKEHPNFELLEGDIRDENFCKEITVGVEAVLHQAALGSVPRSIDNPIATNSVNVDGFLNMLDASRRAGIKRFVYAASSSTYGDHKALPKVEEQIGKPLSPYAVTKYVNELYARVYHDLYGMEVIGLRYFNVFGRNQDPDGAYAAAIPRFIKSLMNHESPSIHGDGEQTRDFTYIDNVLKMNELALTTSESEAFGEVFNVAFGEQTTINAIVEKIRELLATFDPNIAQVELSYAAPRLGDVRHSLASIDKAKRVLGYQPSHSVLQGLDEAIHWYWKDLSE